MFTVEQIKQAHAKVKTGADFPAYVREIAGLGVTGYTTYVSDGRTDYFGANGFKATDPARYEAQTIAAACDVAQFKAGLKAHQQGQTDYPAFIALSAATGVEKWTVDMDSMTCTYYDKAGNALLEEQLPQ